MPSVNGIQFIGKKKKKLLSAGRAGTYSDIFQEGRGLSSRGALEGNRLWIQAFNSLPTHVLWEEDRPQALVCEIWKGFIPILIPSPTEGVIGLRSCSQRNPIEVPPRFFEAMVSMALSKLPIFMLLWQTEDGYYLCNSANVCEGNALKTQAIAGTTLTGATLSRVHRRELTSLAGIASFEGVASSHRISFPVADGWLSKVEELAASLVEKAEEIGHLPLADRFTVLVRAAKEVPWCLISSLPVSHSYYRPRLVEDRLEHVITGPGGVPIKGGDGRSLLIETVATVKRSFVECAQCGTEESLGVCQCGCGQIYCSVCECRLHCLACGEETKRGHRDNCDRCGGWVHEDCECNCLYCENCNSYLGNKSMARCSRCKKCNSPYCFSCWREFTKDGVCINCRTECGTCGATEIVGSNHKTFCSLCKSRYECPTMLHRTRDGSSLCSWCFTSTFRGGYSEAADITLYVPEPFVIGPPVPIV